MVTSMRHALGSLAVFAFAAISMAQPQPTPKPRPSVIVLYRRGGVWSNALDFPMSVDGSAVGTIHNGLFIRVSTIPGVHKITAGGSFLTQGETTSIKTEEGRTYYVRIDNLKRMHERVAMKLVNPEAATKDLSKLKELEAPNLN